MPISTYLVRLARPTRFLYTMSLSTGASLIVLSLALNKLSGVYGILAVLTGYHLSAVQLSMYIYSIFALGLTAFLAPHIKTRSPLHCLALAWFYILDSFINVAYTTVFAVTWFLVLAQHASGQGNKSGPGAGMIDDTSGFTSPKHNVSHVEIGGSSGSPNTTSDVLGGGDGGEVNAHPANSAAGTDGGTAFVMGAESINSIGIIITLWTIRAYFCVVMLAYARTVVRQHIVLSAARSGNTNPWNLHTNLSSKISTGMAENPFSESKPEGQGWKGKLGRFLIALGGKSYWLGGSEAESREDEYAWMAGMGRKFRTSGSSASPETEGMMLHKVGSGPAERERRRRSGTDPPLPRPSMGLGMTASGISPQVSQESRMSVSGAVPRPSISQPRLSMQQQPRLSISAPTPKLSVQVPRLNQQVPRPSVSFEEGKDKDDS